MRQQIDQSVGNRGFREYLWFSITLMLLLVCAAIKDTQPLSQAQATSQAAESRY